MNPVSPIGHLSSSHRSSIQLIGLAVGDLGGLDQAAGDLLAERVDVDAAGLLGVGGVGVVHVDVEDEGVIGFRLEPVDVVLVVRDGREFAGSEGPVDRRADQVVVVFVFDPVEVAAVELAAEDEAKREDCFPKCLDSSPSNCGDIDVPLTQSIHVYSYDDRFLV